MDRKCFFAASLLVVIFFASCKNTWEQEDKDAFFQSCIDEAKAMSGSTEKAKNYCTCLTDRMMQKYPHESDALENMDSVINDPEFQKCKDLLK